MDALNQDPLILAITAEVRTLMSRYDASHSFDHIQRVVGLSQAIYASDPRPDLDPRVVLLAALLHDVGDHKYPEINGGDGNDDPATAVQRLLLRHGAGEELARRVQAVCLGVSYSSEIKDPERVRRLIGELPELAVVQDADRIDAIGAVGIGRMFTYGGARTNRSMDSSMGHLDEKLLRLEGMMKTPYGRELAKERTKRMQEFKRYWQEEMGFSSAMLKDE